MSAYRERGGSEGGSQLRELCEMLRAGESRRAMLGAWFFRFEQMLMRNFGEAERLFTPAEMRGTRT